MEGPIPYNDAARREEAWRQAHLRAGCELLNAVPCVDGLYEGRERWTWQEALSEVRALATRLGGGNNYPTRRQFADNGLGGLDTTTERRLGGHRRVAAKLGLAMPRPEWSPRSAERAVRRLVADLDLVRYPTPAEFEAAGQSGLFQAIATRFGGHSDFARRLGLPRSRTRWTSERVDHAIRAVADAVLTGRYPTEREMQSHGPPGLPNAASQFGGNHLRAAWLGRRMTREVWSLNTASAAVLKVVAALSLDAYPTQAQFRAAGMAVVHRAIRVHLGGHDAMATHLGLPRRQGHSGQ